MSKTAPRTTAANGFFKRLTRTFRPFNVFSLLVIVSGMVFAFRLANVLTFWNLPAASIGAVTPAGAQHAENSNEEPPPLTKADLQKAVEATAHNPDAPADAANTHLASADTNSAAGNATGNAAGAPAAADNNAAAGGVTGGTVSPDGTAPASTGTAAAGGDVAGGVAAPDDDQPQAFSTSELEVLQSLSKRRDELDKREKAISQREALLSAAEQEVDHKIAELNKLKGEIEDLLGQQQTMENDRIESLVKIYENMKPKDAATIFNTLDMDVLLNVISHMNERKVAPIIAAMDPQKARIVTIRLAEQHKLPSAPDTSAPTQ